MSGAEGLLRSIKLRDQFYGSKIGVKYGETFLKTNRLQLASTKNEQGLFNTMQRKRLVFPFSAVVDLDKLKLAILINAINPKIGGLLIRGPKGSGKSTVVRALTDILPKIRLLKIARLVAILTTYPTCVLNAVEDAKEESCQWKRGRCLLLTCL